MTLWRHWIVGQLDASLIAAMLLAIAVLLRHRLSPRVRSAILLIALIRLVMPPFLRSPWSEALVDVPPIDEGRLLMALGLQWDGAMLIAAITTSVSLFLLARIAWTFATIERRWIASTDASPLQAGGIEVRISRHGEGPLAAGLRRKLIIVPASILELDRAALDAVLAHEIAHHDRRDLLWLALAEILKSAAWFNPLAHAAARALAASREDGSDDWAVRNTSNDPFTYARALLQSARMVSGPHPLGAAGAHPMGRRLQRLLDSGAAREGRLGFAGVLVIVLCAAAALPGAHMPLPQDRDTERVVIVKKEVLRS
jgi:beta-lactamase regulating signal transducer with metallopeptidase domain